MMLEQEKCLVPQCKVHVDQVEFLVIFTDSTTRMSVTQHIIIIIAPVSSDWKFSVQFLYNSKIASRDSNRSLRSVPRKGKVLHDPTIQVPSDYIEQKT